MFPWRSRTRVTKLATLTIWWYVSVWILINPAIKRFYILIQQTLLIGSHLGSMQPIMSVKHLILDTTNNADWVFAGSRTASNINQTRLHFNTTNFPPLTGFSRGSTVTNKGDLLRVYLMPTMQWVSILSGEQFQYLCEGDIDCRNNECFRCCYWFGETSD